MRRFSVLLALMGVVLVGILAVQTRPVTVAQEATPTPGEGLTFEALAAAPGIALPATGDLSIARWLHRHIQCVAEETMAALRS